MSDKPQVDKFRALARELKTDDDQAAFEERLKKLAKTAAQAEGHPIAAPQK